MAEEEPDDVIGYFELSGTLVLFISIDSVWDIIPKVLKNLKWTIDRIDPIAHRFKVKASCGLHPSPEYYKAFFSNSPHYRATDYKGEFDGDLVWQALLIDVSGDKIVGCQIRIFAPKPIWFSGYHMGLGGPHLFLGDQQPWYGSAYGVTEEQIFRFFGALQIELKGEERTRPTKYIVQNGAIFEKRELKYPYQGL